MIEAASSHLSKPVSTARLGVTGPPHHRGRRQTPVEDQAMLNKVRRHLNRVNNLRELNRLDERLRCDIGLPCLAEQQRSRAVLLLPLGPGDRMPG
jgi:hypothetical protein